MKKSFYKKEYPGCNSMLQTDGVQNHLSTLDEETNCLNSCSKEQDIDYVIPVNRT